MSDLTPPPINTPPARRSSNEKILFWILWGIFALPLLIGLLMTLGSMGGILLIPCLIQLAILVVSILWLRSPDKPFSKVMWLLVGGSVLLYFILLGSCVVMLMGLSGANFH
ncbi:MAG: hypothetical protein E6Q83_09500 [Thiothrix sp.]|nr:MAG: hypothetical protein E6Q83_09500 [Thiothrix sp.]